MQQCNAWQSPSHVDIVAYNAYLVFELAHEYLRLLLLLLLLLPSGRGPAPSPHPHQAQPPTPTPPRTQPLAREGGVKGGEGGAGAWGGSVWEGGVHGWGIEWGGKSGKLVPS